MLERIPDLPGVSHDAQGYLDDFWSYFHGPAEASLRDFWKLERRQHFVEPGVPSWDAFAAGDWDRARELARQTLPEVRQYVADSRQHLRRRRVRVVDTPVTPYLQWEMQMLRVRVEAGDAIRVIPAPSLREWEWDESFGQHRPLPELILLGSEVMYEVGYDDTGAHCGGRRINDPEVISACAAELTELWEAGEDLRAYFDRKIAPLPPPVVSSQPAL